MDPVGPSSKRKESRSFLQAKICKHIFIYSCLIKRIVAGWPLSDLPARFKSPAATGYRPVNRLLFSTKFIYPNITTRTFITKRTNILKISSSTISFTLLFTFTQCVFFYSLLNFSFFYFRQITTTPVPAILFIFDIFNYRDIWKMYTYIQPSLSFVHSVSITFYRFGDIRNSRRAYLSQSAGCASAAEANVVRQIPGAGQRDGPRNIFG